MAGELGLHVGGQLAEEDGVDEVVGLMVQLGRHLGVEGRGAAVAEGGHVQHLVATLQRRDGEALEWSNAVFNSR